MFKRILFSLFLAIILVGSIVFLNTITIGDGTNRLSGLAVQDENTKTTNTVLQDQQQAKPTDETTKKAQEAAASAEVDVKLRIVEG